MRLIVNLSNNLSGGGLQVALSFLSECRHFDQNEYHVFLSPNVARQTDRSLFGRNFIFYDIPTAPFWKLGRLLSPLEKQIRPDVVFTVFGPSYWRPKAKHIMGFARGHYIYPESAFLKQLPDKEKLKFYIKKSIQCFYIKHDADVYVTETEDVTARFKKIFGKSNAYTVSNTCGRYYFSPQHFNPKLPARQPGEFRLLTLSAYYPHKNLEVIPKIIDALKDSSEGKDIRFVLTLKPEDYQRVIPPQYREWVYNIGPVPVKECPALYQECDVMFLPTLLECFSASYPEAMAMDRPILTSDLDFAHSICGDAAIYFDPMDPCDIARKAIALKNNLILRQSLVEKGRARIAAFPSARERAECYLKLCAQYSHGVLDGC